MTRAGTGGWWRRAIRPAIYIVGLMPAAWTLHLGLSDQLGADPLKVLERTLGLWSLRFLVIGLAITPLWRLGGPNLIGYRRATGLLAFFYAVFHVTVYVWLDQGLDFHAVWGDIVKRPYITIGMVAFLILLPLAITSNDAMVKRMGAKAWAKLHRWVYLAAAAAALHFIMLVKTWPAEPVIYAALIAVLLSWRLWDRLYGAPARARARTRRRSA
jgi:sulfoxide reductase heme-binding subunit YedZ